MDIGQRVAVVTGGASGIGRSLCLAFARRDATGVVVADVDAAGAAEVAAQIEAYGHRALAVTVDVGNAAEAEALVARAEEAFGRIDLLCSNAGIIVGGGLEVPDEAWSRMWAINVQSHVDLTRAVLPGMQARGEGYLVYTASAAGLLTELGSAPYSVTKHAVVALAEWLAITHADQGIRVSCLCPQLVSTNLGATSRRLLDGGPVLAAGEPGAGALPGADGIGVRQSGVDGVLTPDQVAECVIEAMADERFLILPHPEVLEYMKRKTGDYDRWLRGMRRLHQKLLERA
jgi:NAD(P)-dependent dehydrogenase (short-subunit alcohol dehydrogenase family)